MKKRVIKIVILGLMMSWASGCLLADTHQTIAHLVYLDKIITVIHNPSGPVYTLTTSDGDRIVTKISAKALFAMYPELKPLLREGIACQDAAFRPVANNRLIHMK